MKSRSAAAATFLTLVVSCTGQAPNNPTAVEVAAKIKALTDQQLIDCLRATTISPFVPINPNTEQECLLAESDRDVAIIEGELADRRHPDLLIAAYESTDDDDQRRNLVKTLSQIDDPKVATFMGSVAFEFPPLAGDYLALDYLAHRCQEPALKRLNRSFPLGKRAAIACVTLRPVVEDFGRCDYRAAAPNLVRALLAPCSSLNVAAKEDLQMFFPGACKQTHSKADEASCFQKLVENDPTQPK